MKKKLSVLFLIILFFCTVLSATAQTQKKVQAPQKTQTQTTFSASKFASVYKENRKEFMPQFKELPLPDRLSFYSYFCAPKTHFSIAEKQFFVQFANDILEIEKGTNTTQKETANKLFDSMAKLTKYENNYFLGVLVPIMEKSPAYFQRFVLKGPFEILPLDSQSRRFFVPQNSLGLVDSWNESKKVLAPKLNAEQSSVVLCILYSLLDVRSITAARKSEIISDISLFVNTTLPFDRVVESCRAARNPDCFNQSSFYKNLSYEEWKTILLCSVLSQTKYDAIPPESAYGPIGCPPKWKEETRAYAVAALRVKKSEKPASITEAEEKLFNTLIKTADIIEPVASSLVKANFETTIKFFQWGEEPPVTQFEPSPEEQAKADAILSETGAQAWFDLYLAYQPLKELRPEWKKIFQKSNQPELKKLAMSIIAETKSAYWINTVANVLREKNTMLVGNALSCLSKLQAKNAIAKVIALVVKLPDNALRLAAPILVHINESKFADIVIRYAKSGDENTRIHAVMGLGLMKVSKAVPLLSSILLDPKESSYIKEKAADALGFIGDTRSIQTFISLLTAPRNDDDMVRARAASYLGSKRAVAAIDALLLNIDTTRFTNLNTAVLKALGDIDNESGLKKLAKLLPEDPSVWMKKRRNENCFYALWALFRTRSEKVQKFAEAVAAREDTEDYVKLIALYWLAHNDMTIKPDEESIWVSQYTSFASTVNIDSSYIVEFCEITTKGGDNLLLDALMRQLGKAHSFYDTWILGTLNAHPLWKYADAVCSCLISTNDNTIRDWCCSIMASFVKDAKSMDEPERSIRLRKIRTTINNPAIPDSSYKKSLIRVLETAEKQNALPSKKI